MSRAWTDAQLTEAHKGARSVSALTKAMGLVVNGGNTATIMRHLNRLGLPVPRIVAKPANQCAKEYRRRYPEKVKAFNDVYRPANLDKFAQYARLRRALSAGAEGSFSLIEFKELCAYYGNQCLCCGKPDKLTADHIVPLTKGGSNYISNIQPLCSRCNSRKHAQTVDYRSTVCPAQ